jgi:hypothetical protein
MDLAEIKFLPSLDETDHPRFAEVAAFLVDRPLDFEAYQLTFERLVAERSIMTGHRVALQSLPVVDTQPETPFSRFIGLNNHAKKKITLVPELLKLYEKIGRKALMAGAFEDTRYVRFLARRGVRDKSIRKKVGEIVRMYDHMRKTRGLVADSKAAEPGSGFSYYDLPWAFDYLGVRKMRDGAHRRAIAAYLGVETLPTLVYGVLDTDEETLSRANPYLRENYEWFKSQVLASYNSSSEQSAERTSGGENDTGQDDFFGPGKAAKQGARTRAA